MNGDQRKKPIGNIYTDRGSFNVSIVFQDRAVYLGNDKQRKNVSIPVFLEIMTNGMEMRIKADDLRGFMGSLVGHTEEFHRTREGVLRQLQAYGVDTSEF